jgi:hypothetical protein
MLHAPTARVAVASLLLGAVVLVPSLTRADEEPAKVLDGAILPQRDANQLREQLLQVPEVGWTNLDTFAFAGFVKQLRDERDGQARAVRNKVKLPEHLSEPLAAQRKQWEACSLTVLGEPDCRMSSEKAKSLEKTAALVRQHRLVSMPARDGKTMVPPKDSAIGSSFYTESFPFKSGNSVPSGMLPAFLQMMEPEAPNSRAVLVELLSHSEDAAASVGLARRAIFDTDPEVRLFAVSGLKQRQPVEYRQTLLDAFRYPWPPAADHAAQALVALGDREALPALKQLLDAAAPDMPFPRTSTDATPMVREVVRVNHLRNCVLCHALSSDPKESLVAPAPIPGAPLSPQYYQGRSRSDSIFVRADVTYLRQDFSLTLPVANAKPWPDEQRFDFLVRTREATKDEVAAAQTPPATYPQRTAVRFAIRELERMGAKEPAASAPGK